MRRKISILLVCVLVISTASAFNPNKSLEKLAIMTYQGNVPVSTDPADEKHPSITLAPDGSILVAFDRKEGALEGHVHFMHSTDRNSWVEVWNTDISTGDMENGLQEWPVIFTPPGGTSIYGSWNDEVLCSIFYINITNPADPSGYEEIYAYDATDWDYERHTFDIAAYDSSRFAVGHVGHIIYAGYDLPSSCQITWFVGGIAGQSGITGDEDYPVGYNNEVAVTANLFWLVWDFPNATTGKETLLIKWGDPIEESDCHLWPDKEIGNPNADYKDPAVGASGEAICIVYMSNDNVFGDFDLKCMYSTDEGETWHHSSLPSESNVDETNPEVYMSGSTVLCAFVRNGNLYFTKSDDYGATWEEPTKVNDVDGTVVDEPGAIDISPAGIVWVDTRNGNQDVYYAPLPSPLITIEIQAGLGIKITVCNEGTEAARNVSLSIDLTGLVLLGKHAEAAIDVLNPGDCITLGHLVFGFGPITITINVGGTTITAKGFVLGPLVLGVS